MEANTKRLEATIENLTKRIESLEAHRHWTGLKFEPVTEIKNMRPGEIRVVKLRKGQIMPHDQGGTFVYFKTRSETFRVEVEKCQ